jgi:cytochrome P450
MEWVRQRVREEVADRRANPREDAVSELVNRTIDGELIPIAYAEGLVALAVGGGVDTTTASTASALVHLHYHPEDRYALIDRPELMDSAIEEFLRVYPPARAHGRTAVPGRRQVRHRSLPADCKHRPASVNQERR